MTLEESSLSPRALLSLPQYGPAIPNTSGRRLLYTTSNYSFDEHASSNEISLKDVDTGKVAVVTNDSGASEPAWLGREDLFLYLKSGDDNRTHLIMGDSKDLSNKYVVGILDGPISGLKCQAFNDTEIHFLVSGQSTSSGCLYKPSDDVEKQSTGRLYNSLPVRSWDFYVDEPRNTIFFGTLQNANETSKFVNTSLINVLSLIPGSECPIPPYGDSSQYDISETGVVFVSKDPATESFSSPASDVYFIPIESFTGGEAAVPQKILVSGLYGTSSTPRFSPGGKSIAFLKMKEAGYESDKRRIIVVPDISNVDNTIELYASEDGFGAWDRSPSSITWSNDCKQLFATADEGGRVKLFSLPIAGSQLPVAITDEGCISSVEACGDVATQLLISCSTFTDPCRYTLLNPPLSSPPKVLHSTPLPSVSYPKVTEIWYPGTSTRIHAFIITPPDFIPTNTYPVIFLIHGGPQYAWHDAFHLTGIYNPLLFAAAGYVVFLPNITGSSGYGQAFTDSIRYQWGGQTYLDLESGFSFVNENMPYADMERAVALGGSWGGYMVNWIAGQELGRKFKALVCDSGIFSTRIFAAATDEGWFPRWDFGGNWWGEGKETLERWDPSANVKYWNTPMMIVHNERDYRHPISEGIAAFNVLQERGVESSFLTFEDEGHMAVLPENVTVLYGEVLSFLERFVGLEVRDTT